MSRTETTMQLQTSSRSSAAAGETVKPLVALPYGMPDEVNSVQINAAGRAVHIISLPPAAKHNNPQTVHP
jgi:hypothetical protein